MSGYRPPFNLTSGIVNLSIEISELIGRVDTPGQTSQGIMLRKANHIRTIYSSLAIENNSLSIDQVSAIISGKHVVGPDREIKEVRNAFNAYETITQLDPYSIDDLLDTHRLMMEGLIKDNGRFRQGGVGVFKGNVPVHIAPPAHLVPFQIRDLFDWHESEPLHPLIKSAIFHYEFEYIHPFSDGNGRIGRFWHTVLLGNWKEMFFDIPVEEQILSHQAEYYEALGKADSTADSTPFVEFILGVMKETLLKLPQFDDKLQDSLPHKLYMILGDRELSAVELMDILGLRHRPSFRANYLYPALEQGLIEMTIPDKPNSRNQRYRRKPLEHTGDQVSD